MRDRETIRVLIVSKWAPPAATGAAIVLGRLLRCLAPDEAVVVCARQSRRSPRLEDRILQESYFVPAFPAWLPREHLLKYLSIPLVIAACLRAISRHRVDLIMAVYPDESYLFAAFLAHALSGIRLAYYVHDLYPENRSASLCPALARRLHARVIEEASVIFTVNEAQRDFYAARYGMGDKTRVLPFVLTLPPAGSSVSEHRTRGKITIGFGGTVYSNVSECLRVMRRIVLRRSDIAFRFFTPTSRRQLAAYGVWHEGMNREFVPDQATLRTRLGECDLLYLPLSFDAGELGSAELRTAFPSKAVDYLASGRPIIVHCPPDYHLARFFAERGAALVVDSLDEGALEEAIDLLAGDADLREKLVAKARAAAAFFDPIEAVLVLRQGLRDALRPARDGE
jgi:hypothetical protein